MRDGKQQDLQDLSLGERAGEGVRDDVEEEIRKAELVPGPGVLGDGPGIERVGDRRSGHGQG